MTADELQLVRGSDEDIAFVMATERLPGFEQLVGRWSEDQHCNALADGRHAYFIARFRSEGIGFAIVRDWASAERVAHIKRVVVSQPDRGHGKVLVAELVKTIFQNTAAHRIRLGVFRENTRARRVYEAIGFQTEGIARGSAFVDSRHRDELVMSLLRTDWVACPQLSARETK